MPSELVPVGDTELVHGPVEVGLHGTYRQDEEVGDLGVGQTSRGEVDELSFSCGERDGSGFESVDGWEDAPFVVGAEVPAAGGGMSGSVVAAAARVYRGGVGGGFGGVAESADRLHLVGDREEGVGVGVGQAGGVGGVGGRQRRVAASGTCCAAARQADDAGQRVSAVAFYRRAATYYATALSQLSHATDNSAERELEIWRRHRRCWDRVVDLQPVPGERLSIPYEGTTLPGYFFRSPDAVLGERRPLVVMNNGSDGATSQMWVEGGAAAAARGYHWMTFDGPGQQAALYERRLFFRPDWEAVSSSL